MKFTASLAVAAAAIALIGAVSAASASATVLCPKKESTCNAGRYKTGEKITGALVAGTNSVFENELGNVSCTKSDLTAVLKAEGGEVSNPTTKISAFTQENCTRANGGGGEACTVTPTNLGAAEVEQWNANFQSEKTWNGNGTYTLLWNTLGAPGYYVVCGKVIDCKFTGASGTAFKFSGGAPSAIAVAAEMNLEGAICPANKPTWKGTWNVTAPSPLFLSVK
jgi:hypothetical protein